MTVRIYGYLSTMMATLLMVNIAYGQAGGEYAYKPGANFDQKGAWVIDHKQDVTIHLKVQPSGKVWYWSRYSNGKKIDGDHFYTRIQMVDGNNKVIVASEMRAGLNAAGFGKTKVRADTKEATIPKNYLKDVRKIRYEVGHYDEVDDKEFWNKVTSVATALIGASGDFGGFAVFNSNALDAGKPVIKF